MKSKIIKMLLITALIIAISIPMISYAVNLEAEKNFLSCDKKEAVKGETLVLTLDLELIQYENFEFTLTSNKDIENVTTEQENIEITNNSDGFKIIANKSELNIDQIDIYYQIPEEIEVGTKIELKGIVKETNNESIEDEVEELKQRITITVVEEKESSKDQDSGQDKEKDQMQEATAEKDQNVSDKTGSNVQMNQAQSNFAKASSSSVLGVQETNTYKGESNNYLSTLEITNFDMNPKFSKTNTTYFIEVGNEVSKIAINAQAEDEDATVNIYGNEDLQDGENKVLISVTAENGDVKIYRIYITRK